MSKIQRFQLPNKSLGNGSEARKYLVENVFHVANKTDSILIDLGTSRAIAGSFVRELVRCMVGYYGLDADVRYVSAPPDRAKMARYFEEEEKERWTSSRS